MEEPLVSILTPVYNGADYLAECIESVIAQSYRKWEYTIVNNCSTDSSLSIALEYAAKDSRIRVVSNERFLGIIANHNEVLRYMSAQARYCKLVYADDWLYPRCIEEMVALAERSPEIGLVGCFMTNGRAIANALPYCESATWQGAKCPGYLIAGKDICRRTLLGDDYAFGTWTALMVRSDLVRKKAPFFNEPYLHADLEACFDVLATSDFGFVQQVLCFSRLRDQSTTTFSDKFNGVIVGLFVVLLKYGRSLLSDDEYRRRLRGLRWEYYRVLGHNVLRLRSGSYWRFHEHVLASVGYRRSAWRLVMAVIAEAATQLRHPLRAIERGWTWWREALSGSDGWAGRSPAEDNS